MISTTNRYFVVDLLTRFVVLCIITVRVRSSSSHCTRSCPGATPSHVPYPFGFSESCEIQLNCIKERIQIGEFQVNVSAESIAVYLPAKCNRPIKDLKPLFGKNYALTLQNELLLQNCSKLPAGCVLPQAIMRRQFMFNNCSDESYCFSKDDEGTGFMKYSDVENSSCRLLFSSVASAAAYTNLALLFQTVVLGWWLDGECNCSSNANCRKITSPVDGSSRFRCECVHGFKGDGFAAGNGCWGGVDHKAGMDHKARVKIIITVSLSGAGILVIIIFSIYFTRMKANNSFLPWRKKAETTIIFEAFLKNHGSLALKRFCFKEVKTMTNHFRDKLGQGGYGSVFKGNLKDGSSVAVKVLNESKGNGEEFINEVASISKTSHVNIVSLLGYCFEESKRALIYEFMPNGSLENYIYNETQSGAHSSLGWETFYQVSVGIARGLEYLHRGCSTRILHFDIKPHNILLDQDFCPKISDFGLAKLCPKKESIISMMGARGTAGYIAPEVFNRNFGGVSHKSDVYSYGMMILEMAGGRKNIKVDVAHTSEIYFPNWIYSRIESDKALEIQGAVTESERVMARKMILVGLWCIQTSPSDRPSMSRVLEMLKSNLEALPIPPKPYLSSPTRVKVGPSSNSQ